MPLKVLGDIPEEDRRQNAGEASTKHHRQVCPQRAFAVLFEVGGLELAETSGFLPLLRADPNLAICQLFNMFEIPVKLLQEFGQSMATFVLLSSRAHVSELVHPHKRPTGFSKPKNTSRTLLSRHGKSRSVLLS